MQISPHVRRIGNEIVAAYLVITPEGATLVDAGLRGHWKEFRAELAAAGLSVGDVRGVILTHGDTDHLGFAERLRREHGVPVYVHHADAARARGEVKPQASWGASRIAPVIRFAWYAARKGGLRTEYLSEVIEMNDGDQLDLPGAPRIVAMPGHSPGSVAVHVESADAVFVGDALTTRHVLTGETGPGPAPFTDDPDAAITAVESLAAVSATWVLPGHGEPWAGGVAAAVAATVARSRQSDDM